MFHYNLSIYYEIILDKTFLALYLFFRISCKINEYSSFWILFMDSIPLQMQIDRAFFENQVNSDWLACTGAILPACSET